MNRPCRRSGKRVNVCVVAALIIPILLISVGSTVYAHFVMSTRLTCFTTVESGDIIIEVTGWKIKSTNTMDVNDNGVIVGDELKIEGVTDGDGKTIELDIAVDPIFPDWNLDLTVDIHNTADSTPVRLIRTIYYFDSDGNQLETDEAGLLSLFRINYFDEWYDSSGNLIPDITTYDIWPCNTVTTLESLTFEGQDYPELQDQTFSFQVEITPTYPTNGG
ncbi:MAG: hypothetical protein OEZ25_05645 [Candidatus Bathyarchaeota archaeon]|nr:hypothetical protein [Candidatus Bathyarchaeota archaeon]